MALSLPSTLKAVLGLIAVMIMQSASAGSKKYVAPGPTERLSVRNQEYLIGVVSFVIVILAGIMGVMAMVNINYDDDTLLMVEVPEDTHHEEQQ
ncbi:hypothetical protein ABB37_02512 [Leptomonas pyrrhocoris]|uniref:Uncharacterized protein n=1 Tax=Leptomonas pyrrhocoris TaxID=157538 RepID=A0A0M9G5N3_LEPPY|nr:hypothetical protein ABB37_02512 [Leptomonas pyrrhocoris]KPA82689.1 hypothetical protein ABB37_02512 [Leptomonas pyrrhocoris]|eukprot:XP_015661128.1 hypothetical protein ABB37_02512 [Leptomonas pyrrhocoris]